MLGWTGGGSWELDWSAGYKAQLQSTSEEKVNEWHGVYSHISEWIWGWGGSKMRCLTKVFI